MTTQRVKMRPKRKRTNSPKPSRLRRFVQTPKGLVTVILSVLALIAICAEKGLDPAALRNTIAAVASALVMDWIVSRFYFKKPRISDGGAVTGLIVAMVLGSLTAWYLTILTVAVALASKHLLKTKRKPIFNPAAVGLLVSTMAFSTMQSWWGGMSLLPPEYLACLCLLGLWTAIRVKKLPQVLAFLGAYAIVSVIFMAFPTTRMDALYALENPMLNSALFLAFFMLTDPPTSPAIRRDQVWFGVLVGTLSVVIYMVFPAELSYLFIALLIGNATKWLQSVWKQRHRLARTAEPGPSRQVPAERHGL
ncbi:RnfABCDGE type electron transport complex subunit D [Alicyclobacillus acidiphilus]|uniref:RnfABCDGE type electron transport complex subunit D n=1 Tax=Alicyclobacillus acidiphilus TaxID=182455 RepID=UPI00082D8DB3|nr:RnfABCDGE type electron transport complex subunit D [Alicyclobacillus acidiphilus]